MCPEGGPPNDQEPSRALASAHTCAASSACLTCGELERAEVAARSEHDRSRAVDCRVLLRRHRDANGCPGRRSE